MSEPPEISAASLWFLRAVAAVVLIVVVGFLVGAVRG